MAHDDRHEVDVTAHGSQVVLTEAELDQVAGGAKATPILE